LFQQLNMKVEGRIKAEGGRRKAEGGMISDLKKGSSGGTPLFFQIIMNRFWKNKKAPTGF